MTVSNVNIVSTKKNLLKLPILLVFWKTRFLLIKYAEIVTTKDDIKYEITINLKLKQKNKKLNKTKLKPELNPTATLNFINVLIFFIILYL